MLRININKEERRRITNKIWRTRIKNIKKDIIISKNTGLIPVFYKIVDRAAAKNIIHKNKASRLKSSVMSKINNELTK